MRLEETCSLSNFREKSSAKSGVKNSQTITIIIMTIEEEEEEVEKWEEREKDRKMGEKYKGKYNVLTFPREKLVRRKL